MCNQKNEVFKLIDHMERELFELSEFIHSNPELGNVEYKAVREITKALSSNGFEIETGLAGLETAFRATYKNGNGGYTIGLICEYDALAELGHGCGHNLQPSSVIGAAVSLSKVLNDRPVTIEVIGTPAEETTSGKIPLAEKGYFDHLDIALMMHGGDRTTVDGRSLAVDNYEFNFTGKESHAAVAPEKGISALDGVIMTFNGIEYLREHVRSDVRIHGIISDGGIAPNIVPGKATAKFSIRASDREYLDQVVERALNVVKGAALTTGTTVQIQKLKSLENKLNVQTLNDILLKNAELVGATNITPPREKTGSTDFSIVTHRVPGACIRVAFVPLGVSNHTQDWVLASNSAEGNRAIITAAKTIAATCLDIIDSDELKNSIKEEFLAAKNQQPSLV